MSILHGLKSAHLYKKGFDNGLKREIEKFTKSVICRARLQGSSIELIARIVSYTPEQVQEILDEMKMK
jgi:hypothetical protein